MFFAVPHLLEQLSELECVYQFELDLIVVLLSFGAVFCRNNAPHCKYLISWVGQIPISRN